MLLYMRYRYKHPSIELLRDVRLVFSIDTEIP